MPAECGHRQEQIIAGTIKAGRCETEVEGEADEEEWDFTGMERVMPNSVPASPRFRMSGIATPGDLGTLTEEVSIMF